jgi:hypothetical protein
MDRWQGEWGKPGQTPPNIIDSHCTPVEKEEAGMNFKSFYLLSDSGKRYANGTKVNGKTKRKEREANKQAEKRQH